MHFQFTYFFFHFPGGDTLHVCTAVTTTPRPTTTAAPTSTPRATTTAAPTTTPRATTTAAPTTTPGAYSFLLTIYFACRVLYDQAATALTLFVLSFLWVNTLHFCTAVTTRPTTTPAATTTAAPTSTPRATTTAAPTSTPRATTTAAPTTTPGADQFS